MVGGIGVGLGMGIGLGRGFRARVTIPLIMEKGVDGGGVVSSLVVSTLVLLRITSGNGFWDWLICFLSFSRIWLKEVVGFLARAGVRVRIVVRVVGCG